MGYVDVDYWKTWVAHMEWVHRIVLPLDSLVEVYH